MNELYCFDETTARKVNHSMGWFVYYEFIRIAQTRRFRDSQIREDNTIDFYMTSLQRFRIDHANIAYQQRPNTQNELVYRTIKGYEQ